MIMMSYCTIFPWGAQACYREMDDAGKALIETVGTSAMTEARDVKPAMPWAPRVAGTRVAGGPVQVGGAAGKAAIAARSVQMGASARTTTGVKVPRPAPRVAGAKARGAGRGRAYRGRVSGPVNVTDTEKTTSASPPGKRARRNAARDEHGSAVTVTSETASEDSE